MANKLRILKMAPQVKNAILAGRLSERHARTLLRIPEAKMQLELIEIIRRDGLSVKATEDLVERTLDKLYADSEPVPRKRVSGVIRDGRLLINGIRKLVEQVCISGLTAKCHVEDQADCFQVTVTIPKHLAHPQG